jgi:hypothetical protein
MVTKHNNTKKKPPAKADPALWEQIVAIGERIPKEELDRHPADFVRNFHQYKHGHPKPAGR